MYESFIFFNFLSTEKTIIDDLYINYFHAITNLSPFIGTYKKGIMLKILSLFLRLIKSFLIAYNPAYT